MKMTAQILKVASLFAALIAISCMAVCPRHNLETVYHGDGSALSGYHKISSMVYAFDEDNFDMAVGGSFTPIAR